MRLTAVLHKKKLTFSADLRQERMAESKTISVVMCTQRQKPPPRRTTRLHIRADSAPHGDSGAGRLLYRRHDGTAQRVCRKGSRGHGVPHLPQREEDGDKRQLLQRNGESKRRLHSHKRPGRPLDARKLEHQMRAIGDGMMCVCRSVPFADGGGRPALRPATAFVQPHTPLLLLRGRALPDVPTRTSRCSAYTGAVSRHVFAHALRRDTRHHSRRTRQHNTLGRDTGETATLCRGCHLQGRATANASAEQETPWRW